MEKLEALHQSIRECESCDLRKECTQVVPGDGTQTAPIMFVGEAPGADEDAQGIPFIGRSGSLLRDNLQKARIKEDIRYITNMVRCRPPDNRTPLPAELEACWPHMIATLRLIKPRILVTLGKPATFTMAHKLGFSKKVGQLSITKLAGKPIYVEERKLYVFPVFHPSYALRRRSSRDEFRAHIKYLGVAYRGWLERKD